MHRTKRNRDVRAFRKGYVQGARGHGTELCPFQVGTKRGEWLGGWRMGHASFVLGYRNDDGFS